NLKLLRGHGLPPLARWTLASIDADGPRLVALGPRDEQGEDTVAIFRFDALGIDTNRHSQRPVEHARAALAPVHARPRQFQDGDQVMVLLEYVDGRIGAHASGGTLQPVAFKARVERSLQTEECVERIGKRSHHGDTS